MMRHRQSKGLVSSKLSLILNILIDIHNVYKDTCKSQQSALITVYIKLCTGPGAFVFYVTHDIYTSFESQRRCYHWVELENSKNAECICQIFKNAKKQPIFSFSLPHDRQYRINISQTQLAGCRNL